MPGFRGAEGKEKGKGVIVRWGLEEAPSKSAGRRTGIPPKAGCGTLGASAHVTTKPSIRQGACFINPALTRGRFCVLPREISSVPWEVGCDPACGGTER